MPVVAGDPIPVLFVLQTCKPGLGAGSKLTDEKHAICAMWLIAKVAQSDNGFCETITTCIGSQRLKELLENQTFEHDPVTFIFKEITKLEGEATANNRKAKLIFLFEWNIKLDFEAEVSGSEMPYKGSIAIPNLSDENEADEVDVCLFACYFDTSQRMLLILYYYCLISSQTRTKPILYPWRIS
ncbi:unnamed protein product [Gongylonema pulchrum]|uniref:Aha1_N domain-containing protein n=1 Tax=Gongylonema pulchrum TaxID=637853 RepID=A0A183EDH1_9BILA|nr:unnamed protein product [Gongylonema pulchrum]